MKPKPVLKKIYLVLFAFTVLIAATINSCKKDARTQQQQSAITDPAVLQAKNWYNNTYMTATVNKSVNSAVNADDYTPLNFAKNTKADWGSAVGYHRFSDDVLEIPIDPAAPVQADLKNLQTNEYFKKEYSKLSYLILKQGENYRAFIMLVIADSAYIKNNPAKLSNNKYNKKDDDFGGTVLYFTPGGKIVSGWFYKNGALAGRLLTQASSSGNTDGSKQVQAIKTNMFVEQCDAWSISLWDQTGTYIIATYTGVDCKQVYVPTGGGGGGGGNGGDGSGTVTGSPFDPCAGAHAVSPGKTAVNSTKQVNIVDPNPPWGSPDPGFPPPEPPSSNPCTVNSNTPFTIKTDSLAKHFPCAVKLIINNLGECGVYTNLVAAFTKTSKPDLTWQDGALSWSTSSSGTFELGHTSLDPTSGIGQSSIITLNSSMLKNSSRLLIAAAAIHETLHAYINYSVNTGVDGITHGYPTGDSWFYGIDTWIALNGLPPNYSNHLDMIADYFDKAVTALKTWDNGAHTDKEYQMATLFGLDNGRDGTSAQQAQLQTEFNSLLTKYSITAADLNTFNITNLNATIDKLPTSGCN